MADLVEQAGALRAQARSATGARGTPEATERLDLIDGIILELVRQAQKAADVAGKELGEPALAKVFALTALYGSGGARAGEERSSNVGSATPTEEERNDATKNVENK